jgi:hypothetical protein
MIAKAGTRYYVSDVVNGRVLVFEGSPAGQAIGALGQADLQGSLANRGLGAPARDRIATPGQVASDGTRLAVVDIGNHRVLVWNAIPTALDDAADVVLGQAGFTARTAATTQGGLRSPMHAVFTPGGGLTVSDTSNHRLMHWASLPASGSAGNASGTSATGQADFGAGTANRGQPAPAANTLSSPVGLLVDGTVLWVADAANNRVVRFDPLPTGDVAATAVAGQADFASAFANRAGPSRYGINNVNGICVSRQYLVVGDRNNARFLVFNKHEAASGAAAIAVIGQADFSGWQNHQGGSPGPNTISNVYTGAQVLGCAIDEDERLYLADRNSNRVLVFNQVPVTNNASADYVLGRADFFTVATPSVSCNSLITPFGGIWASGGKLFVPQYNTARVSIFSLPITGHNPAAAVVVGQSGCTGGGAATGQGRIWSASAAYSDGSRLYVGDYMGASACGTRFRRRTERSSPTFSASRTTSSSLAA